MTEKGKRESRPRGMSHDSPPQPGGLPSQDLEAALAAIRSEYTAAVRALGDELRGKVVAGSAGGHSGYVLRFTDGSWVAVWLNPTQSRMDFATGRGEPTDESLAHLSDAVVPDASRPLDVDRPYAHQSNDIAAEAAKSEAKSVVGVSIGERALSIRFPEGRELEGSVFQNAAGVYCLRVFWEQW